MLCCVVTIVDPALVLGGGVGQALGFAAAITASSSRSLVMPDRVQRAGQRTGGDGCLAAGAGWPGALTRDAACGPRAGAGVPGLDPGQNA